jgi:hypothetical protein
MFPGFATHNGPGNALTYPDTSCDLCQRKARCIKPSHFSYIFVFQFTAMMTFSLWVIGTIFLEAILSVVALCSKEQMLGSDTGWRIAVMANTHSFWYWTKMYLPRKDVGRGGCIAPIDSAVLSVSLKKPAISQMRLMHWYGTLLINTLPETLFDRTGTEYFAFSRTEFTPSFSDNIALNRELDAAIGAVPKNAGSSTCRAALAGTEATGSVLQPGSEDKKFLAALFANSDTCSRHDRLLQRVDFVRSGSVSCRSVDYNRTRG